MKVDQEALFRKSALDRMSSPEQLDVLIRVVPARAWVALIAVLFLIAMIVLWGWFGVIPTIVKGPCIILNSTGLASVNSDTTGQIKEIFVTTGDTIQIDQAVAHVAQVELNQLLLQFEAELVELKLEQDRLLALGKTLDELNSEEITRRRENLTNELRTSLNRVALAKSQSITQRELLDKGLVTKQALINSEQSVVQLQQRSDTIRAQIESLNLQKIEKMKLSDDEESRLSLRVGNTQRSIDTLKQRIQRNSIVRSPYAGRVVEISARAGDLISGGLSVVKLEQVDNALHKLEVIVYVNTRDAKKAVVGLETRVIPSTVKREESGFMKARVVSVSNHSVSAESMMQRLQNQSLVSQFSESGAPSEIVIELEHENADYLWSSIASDDRSISSGTLCDAEIIIKRQRPISLVVPSLKKTFGID